MNPVQLITTIRDRIYSDFLMPSRLDAYRGLLETATAADYSILPIEDYWRAFLDGTIDPERRYFVLRHDIDTDPDTARMMWHVERSIGVKSSHFFRLSTLDLPLMRAIADDAGRVSYHYEELATVAKRRRPRSTEALMSLVPEARDLFRNNLEQLRARTGLAMDVVASHGDFVNRKLDLSNREIFSDPAFRIEMAITLETRDELFLGSVTSHQSDAPYPQWWIRGNPMDQIAHRDRVIYLLVHPRHWRVNRRVNARDDAERLAEGLAYLLPTRSESSR